MNKTKPKFNSYQGKQDLSCQGKQDLSCQGKQDLSCQGKQDLSCQGKQDLSCQGKQDLSCQEELIAPGSQEHFESLTIQSGLKVYAGALYRIDEGGEVWYHPDIHKTADEIRNDQELFDLFKRRNLTSLNLENFSVRRAKPIDFQSQDWSKRIDLKGLDCARHLSLCDRKECYSPTILTIDEFKVLSRILRTKGARVFGKDGESYNLSPERAVELLL